MICNQVYGYFSNDSLFNSDQYGFRKAQLTEIHVIEMFDRTWDYLNKGDVSLTVMCILYTALILPNFQHALLIWGFIISRLIKLQKMAIHIIMLI